MLDIQQHEYILKRILKDIASDIELNNQLVFKGGTCLYIFYGLNRFSVDLDFSLFSGDRLAVEKINKLLANYLDIENGRLRVGESGWIWEASYEKGERKVQIDVSKRQFPDKYKIMQFYGLSLRTLDESSLFAHKLCAVLDRKHFQNRDLFDSHFMFEKRFEINEEIIKLRTGQSLINYLRTLDEFIKNQVDKKRIMQGLGELIDKKNKQWVKDKLVDELLVQIRLKIDSLKKTK